MATITVKYSCEECGAKDEEVIVPARMNKESNVVEYVERVVMREVARQHILRHLLCESKKVQSPMIPIDQNDPDGWVGKPKAN